MIKSANERVILRGGIYMSLLFVCPICNGTYKHGPGKYEGHKLDLYGGIFACNTCWDGNHDGWSPHAEENIKKIMKEKQMALPNRNKKGLLPRN